MTRGEVVLADLNPQRGTEPGKTRPVLIVQSQALLDAGHPSSLVIPLTTNVVAKAAPLRVSVSPGGKIKRRSDLLIDQLRSIDNRRLVGKPLRRLGADQMKEVDQAMREVLDLEF